MCVRSTCELSMYDVMYSIIIISKEFILINLIQFILCLCLLVVLMVIVVVIVDGDGCGDDSGDGNAWW